MLLALSRSADGLDIQELSAMLGEDDDLGRAKLSAALSRAHKAGLVTFTGRMNDRIYHLAPGVKPERAAR